MRLQTRAETARGPDIAAARRGPSALMAGAGARLGLALTLAGLLWAAILGWAIA